ncbi:unnamed protein product [Phytophthora fragariaefolia]|uniref:Unnamed protein product n=1 Tax=Phytophthora fragariaefolia TaxID=1490495 RepID=A0A9W6YN40_9STRA|nr:unnamed protein product [Phytophthora fragariaefolia]
MVFASPHGEIPIPKGKTAWDWVEKHAANIPTKPAYVCAITERTLTFADVHDQARKICAALAAEGIKKGDSVGIITHAKMVDTATKAASLCGIELNRVYTIGHANISASLMSIAYVSDRDELVNKLLTGHCCRDMLTKDIPFPNLPPVDPDAIVAMPFSSGTTARPKGVLLSGRALFAGAMMASHSEKDMEYTMTVLPFFHIMSTLLFHMAFYRGWGTIIFPKFMPEEYLSAIAQYKVWNVYVAPPIVQFFAKHPLVDNYDLSSLKYIGSGGAPMGTEVEEAVFKRIGAKVGQGYGMTELCGPVTMPAYEINRPGSVGQLLPNSKLRVQSLNNGAELGTNEVGELVIHTPAMMDGYHKNPEETKKSITADGFVRTGDVGYIGDDGFIFIVDRVKEMIKYKGHQVAPAELEDLLHGHPAIVDSCCVRGKDLESGEEVPKAFVVLRAGASSSAEDIMDFVAEKVAPFKRVRQIEFVESIPKTMSGKILRCQLQLRENAKIKGASAP